MENLRAAVKLIRFLFVTVFYYFVILLGHGLAIFGFDNIAWAATIRSRWGKSVINIFNIRLTVKGTPPKPPFFLVANHLSYIDVWVLFSTAKGTFVAKEDLRKWPLVGFVLATSGIIFVNRQKKTDVKRVNDEIARYLTPGQGVFLFPEGTTSSGMEVLPFKSSLFQFPAQQELEVSCAAISYSIPGDELATPMKVSWWDDTPFLIHLWNALKLKEIEASITFCDQKIKHSDRKYLAQSSYNLIKEAFTPIKHPDHYAEAHLGS